MALFAFIKNWSRISSGWIDWGSGCRNDGYEWRFLFIFFVSVNNGETETSFKWWKKVWFKKILCWISPYFRSHKNRKCFSLIRSQGFFFLFFFNSGPSKHQGLSCGSINPHPIHPPLPSVSFVSSSTPEADITTLQLVFSLCDSALWEQMELHQSYSTFFSAWSGLQWTKKIHLLILFFNPRNSHFWWISVSLLFWRCQILGVLCSEDIFYFSQLSGFISSNMKRTK